MNENYKLQFFKYIGTEDSLVGYQKSYKIVLLLALIKIMDDEYKSPSYAIIQEFKKHYQSRKDNGLIVEVKDSPMINVEKMSDNEVWSLIKRNPYQVIHQRNYLNIEKLNGIEYMKFPSEFLESMGQEDIQKLCDEKQH